MFFIKDGAECDISLRRCSIHRNIRCAKSSVTMALVHQYHKHAWSQLMGCLWFQDFVPFSLYRKVSLMSIVIKREHLSNDPVRERLSRYRCTFEQADLWTGLGHLMTVCAVRTHNLTKAYLFAH